jgi:hypothetical protein
VAISLLVTVARCRAIPATALRGLPRDGSVEDVVSALLSRATVRGMKKYEMKRRRK